MKKGLAFGVWKLIPLAIWWSVWKERNRRVFEGKDLSLHDFKLYFLRILYSWSQALDESANLTFVDFGDILCKDIKGFRFLVLPFCTWAIPPWCLLM